MAQIKYFINCEIESNPTGESVLLLRGIEAYYKEVNARMSNPCMHKDCMYMPTRATRWG